MKFEILGQDIRIDERLTSFIKEKLATCMNRYGQRIRRITISLYDVDGPRAGIDKRCRVVFRLAGGGQSVVECGSHDWRDAITQAAQTAEQTMRKRMEQRRTVRKHQARRGHDMLWADFDVTEVPMERLTA